MKKREEIIKQLVSDQLNGQFGPEVIHTEGNLLDAYGLDSLDMVELVMAVEEKFSIEIPEEYADFERVGDILRYLDSRLGSEG